MPALSGFSDNAFQSRDDILLATCALLRPLTPHKSVSGSRIKLAVATGTGFDEISAQLEGFARPLWVVADLLRLFSEELAPRKGGSALSTWKNGSFIDELDLRSWLRGLFAGVDPDSPDYWGAVGNHDQRMVEMEPIAYALLSAPAQFLEYMRESGDDIYQNQMGNLRSWLSSINEKVVPPSNWRWFRIFVNLALVKFCGVAYETVKPFMETDFEVLDTFYLGNGWSSDGLWSEDKKQVDYYSGSFAIQYSQLAYIRFAADLDPERVERYRGQAREFSTTFWRYFDVDGAATPFGRSLTYRFTFVAFFSAAIAAGIDLPEPLNELGVVKGLLYRHLRWWAKQTDIFNTDGTLSIGYTYPNMYMSEDYNSPQSTYWCLKTFAILGLPEDHEFWTCQELPHPLSPSAHPLHESSGPTNDGVSIERVARIEPAMHITCSFPEHHFLLSAGQFTKKPHKAREAKYSKFAYSSAFAFSVPTGTSLEQIAPDSTLSISDDDGDTWKVRWEPVNARLTDLVVHTKSHADGIMRKETLPALVSTWRPWKKSSLEIETTLVPTSKNWPGWHVRFHKLQWATNEDLDVKCVDSGFAISSQSATGGVLPILSATSIDPHGISEGVLQDDSSCLVLSDAGACGVVNLDSKCEVGFELLSTGLALKPDANTNLIAQRTLIPTVRHSIRRAVAQQADGQRRTEKRMEASFVTGIFAVSSSAGLKNEQVLAMWNARPIFTLAGTED